MVHQLVLQFSKYLSKIYAILNIILFISCVLTDKLLMVVVEPQKK